MGVFHYLHLSLSILCYFLLMNFQWKSIRIMEKCHFLSCVIIQAYRLCFNFYHSNDICGIVISSSFTFLTFLPVQTKTPIQLHLFSPCFLLPIPTQSASFNRFFIVSLSSSADSPSLSNQIYPVCILISAEMSES